MSALARATRLEPGPTLRGRIAVLVSAAIAISYLDRQTLALAGSLPLVALTTICLAIPRILPLEGARA